MKDNHVHIGKRIQETLKEKGISASWLAKKIHCHKTNMYKIFQMQYVHPQLLEKISIALDTDFFIYHSEYIEMKQQEKLRCKTAHFHSDIR